LNKLFKKGDVVMKSYLINNLENSRFDSIITLLDYQIPISRCLKSIRISPNKAKKILIDTLLCSGMNEYRFIETNLSKDGTINLDKYSYVNVDNDVLKRANEIVKHQPVFLRNSVLPESQVRSLV